MAATAAQIAQLRRLVNEPDLTTYDDAMLAMVIESYPLTDANGQDQYAWSPYAQTTQVANTFWVPTYDIQSAAADIWEEKAAGVAQDYDFSADGGSYSRSQVHEQYMQRARFHRARRAPGAIKVVVYPPQPIPTIQPGNAAEPPYP